MIGVISTILGLIGFALALPTFGTSFALTGAGIALSVGAAGVSIRNGYKDYKTTGEMNEKIKKIFEPLRDQEEVLKNFMTEMKDQMDDLLNNGFDLEEAAAITAFRSIKGVVECGRVAKNAGSIAVPIISSFTSADDFITTTLSTIG